MYERFWVFDASVNGTLDLFLRVKLYTTELKQLHIPDEISKQIIQVTNYLHRNAHIWDYVRSAFYPFLEGGGKLKTFVQILYTSDQSYNQS